MPQRQNPNDVLNVGQFAMAQFSTLNSDFKPPTFGKTGEYKDSLTSENEWRLPDTWLRMPTVSDLPQFLQHLMCFIELSDRLMSSLKIVSLS